MLVVRCLLFVFACSLFVVRCVVRCLSLFVGLFAVVVFRLLCVV